MTSSSTFDPMVSGLSVAYIPTDDPVAPLKFCQALAHTLSTSSAPHAETADVPTVSVVIPVFNEQENFLVLYARLIKTLEDAEPSFQIVFVDDGSRDASPKMLRELSIRDRRVLVVELAQNFGHQVGISAGLDYARGVESL